MARQESYQGLARKWRPQRFEDLVGQEAVAQSFQSALRQDRVAHGHLLVGPRGVGKTTSARILAKALNCEKGPSPTPCGECRHCIDIAAGSDMDVIEIDAASNNGVDDVRELRERVNNAPFSARYKVYIIDEVHMMSSGAFNALLKTLEEPPPQVIFILATTELEKVPETIRSRCALHTFRRMSSDDVARRLEQVAAGEGVAADPAELREVFSLIGRAVEGGMRDAMMAFDQIIAMTEGKPTVEAANRLLGLADQASLVQTIDWLADGKAAEVLKLIEELSERGRNLERFVKSLIAMLRDLMLLQATANDALVSVSGEALAAARQQARRLPAATLFNMLNQLFELESRLKQSTQTRFLVEFTLLRIAAVRPVVSLDEILQRVQALPEAAFNAAPGAPSAPVSAAPVKMQEVAPERGTGGSPVIPPSAPVIPVPRPAKAVEAAPEPAMPPMAAVFGESAPQAALASAPPAPEAPATPAAAPASSPAALAGMGRDQMLDLMISNLPDAFRFLGRYLRQAAALRAEGAVLRIEWASDSSFGRKFIEKPENSKVLEETLTQLAGTPMHVTNADADPGARPQSAPAPAAPGGAANSGPARSMWANADQADLPLAAIPADEAAEGEDDDETPASFAPRRAAAESAEAEGAPAQQEAAPADKRTPLQKAQDLITSSEDASRRVKLLQDMLGGRLIDDSGQPLPA